MATANQSDASTNKDYSKARNFLSLKQSRLCSSFLVTEQFSRHFKSIVKVERRNLYSLIKVTEQVEQYAYHKYFHYNIFTQTKKNNSWEFSLNAKNVSTWLYWT